MTTFPHSRIQFVQLLSVLRCYLHDGIFLVPLGVAVVFQLARIFCNIKRGLAVFPGLSFLCKECWKAKYIQTNTSKLLFVKSSETLADLNLNDGERVLTQMLEVEVSFLCLSRLFQCNIINMQKKGFHKKIIEFHKLFWSNIFYLQVGDRSIGIRKTIHDVCTVVQDMLKEVEAQVDLVWIIIILKYE